MTFADQIIAYNQHLSFDDPLPDGIQVMNPYREHPGAAALSAVFYRKYYADHRRRRLILGINPGRFGAGLTGVPFTDTKRLEQVCGIPCPGLQSHEPSSVFVYAVVEAYGGPERFYEDFFIQSVCPLGFTRRTAQGSTVNYNYYDDPGLQRAATPFILKNLEALTHFNLDLSVCYCFGTGKNAGFLNRLNEEHHFFGKILPLEHPRFIMQYRARQMADYVNKYLEAFTNL